MHIPDIRIHAVPAGETDVNENNYWHPRQAKIDKQYCRHFDHFPLTLDISLSNGVHWCHSRDVFSLEYKIKQWKEKND